jgi:hypothetical protein
MGAATEEERHGKHDGAACAAPSAVPSSVFAGAAAPRRASLERRASAMGDGDQEARGLQDHQRRWR